MYMKRYKLNVSERLDLILHSHRLTRVGLGKNIIQKISNTLSENYNLSIKTIFLFHIY